MTADDEELIERLLAKAGMLMEDTSAAALLKNDKPLAERLALVLETTRELRHLIAAASVIANLKAKPAGLFRV